jgi:aryl-alcohol dehydrogenase-like predicted oxidoreductase
LLLKELMEYQPLGKSGMPVSRIGFGCMSLGADQAAATRLLHAAIDKGINFFDTADLYDKGKNEEIVGNALKTKRKNILIATKVGNEWKKDGSGWHWNPRKEYIVSAIEKSLARLQTDYIDLYQLHGGTIEDNIDETIDAFDRLQQQGKIRAYGISSIRPNVIRAYAYRSAACSVMMQYSLLDRRPEEACLDLLNDRQMAVLARGCLAGGLLVNKPAKNYLSFTGNEVKQAGDAIATVSGNLRSHTETALKFVLQQPAIASAVVGIRTMEQLAEAVITIEKPALTSQELFLLEQSISKNYYKEHR